MNAVLESFLTFGLGVQEFLFLLEKGAVVSGDTQDAVGIYAAQFRSGIGEVFEEVTVVADDDAGELRALEQFFEPLDAGEIEVVGGFVEQQDVGGLHQGFGDGEAFLPSAGEGGGLGVEVFEAGATESLGEAACAFVFGSVLERCLDDRSYGAVFRELGILHDVAHPGAFAHGDFTAVGVDLSRKNAEKRGFAGAVGANQSDAIAFGDGEPDILKERIRAECLRQALDIDDGWQRGMRSETFRIAGGFGICSLPTSS